MPDEGSLEKSSNTTFSEGAREIYYGLLNAPEADESRAGARHFLDLQLDRAAELQLDLPRDAAELSHWLESNIHRVGREYSAYLKSRQSGAPRRYFSCKSHALAFLQGVAPTKLVDGAWLYGTIQHWQDPRFFPLIRTYLEELGDGDPTQNHVLLYQGLLRENGCETLPELSDVHYLQGAIQLALAHNADQFMPEVLGYNLGYEQLPLHLLITAFELAELRIDPYYFTLHVTIDNASSGHARKAVQAVRDCMPVLADPKAFLQRVANGYGLNFLGLSTLDVIAGFDLERELINALKRKAHFGKHMHSDFCRIDGRTVNEWLANPNEIASFLRALENKGWIRRGEDVSQSRFWHLVEGTKAQMTGVFSHYEKQLLRDWIITPEKNSNPSLFRPYRSPRSESTAPENGTAGAIDDDVSRLIQELHRLSIERRMQLLIELMAPSTHATAVGLFATRQFAATFRSSYSRPRHWQTG